MSVVLVNESGSLPLLCLVGGDAVVRLRRTCDLPKHQRDMVTFIGDDWKEQACRNDQSRGRVFCLRL